VPPLMTTSKSVGFCGDPEASAASREESIEKMIAAKVKAGVERDII